MKRCFYMVIFISFTGIALEIYASRHVSTALVIYGDMLYYRCVYAFFCACLQKTYMS